MLVGALLGSNSILGSHTSTQFAPNSTLESAPNLIAETRGLDPGCHRQIAWFELRGVEALLLVAPSEKSWNKLCYEGGRVQKHRNLRLDLALGRRGALITPVRISKSERNSQTCWECVLLTSLLLGYLPPNVNMLTKLNIITLMCFPNVIGLGPWKPLSCESCHCCCRQSRVHFVVEEMRNRRRVPIPDPVVRPLILCHRQLP